MKKYTLEFSKKNPRAQGSAKDFEKFLQKAVKVLCEQKGMSKLLQGGVLQLVLVDDPTIQKINREYRGMNKPTDVISLSYFEEPQFPGEKVAGEAGNDLVGEIIISLDTAKKQAKEHKKTVMQEMQLLFVHGVLHIFGYDHEEPKERKKMFDLQDKIIGNKSWRLILEKAYADLA